MIIENESKLIRAHIKAAKRKGILWWSCFDSSCARLSKKPSTPFNDCSLLIWKCWFMSPNRSPRSSTRSPSSTAIAWVNKAKWRNNFRATVLDRMPIFTVKMSMASHFKAVEWPPWKFHNFSTHRKCAVSKNHKQNCSRKWSESELVKLESIWPKLFSSPLALGVLSNASALRSRASRRYLISEESIRIAIKRILHSSSEWLLLRLRRLFHPAIDSASL